MPLPSLRSQVVIGITTFSFNIFWAFCLVNVEIIFSPKKKKKRKEGRKGEGRKEGRKTTKGHLRSDKRRELQDVRLACCWCHLHTDVLLVGTPRGVLVWMRNAPLRLVHLNTWWCCFREVMTLLEHGDLLGETGH